jgi:hypothetical protein
MGRFFQERLRITNKISPFIQVFVPQRRRQLSGVFNDLRPVVETCRRLKIPIREYLCSILPGLANLPINRVAELTPASWLARN